MYQRIFVAIDGSDTSQLAFDHALSLARNQSARLIVAHVVETLIYPISPTGGYPFNPETVQQTLRDQGVALLEQAQAKGQSAGVEIETALLEVREATERTAATLAREAQRRQADLIVLGTHGRRGFDRLLMGSVAETLLRSAAMPVLLVRAKQTG